MSNLTMRQAQLADAETVAAIWTQAARELAAQGFDQWQYPVRTDAIRQTIAAGTCWMIEDESGHIIGTVTLDDYADPKLWQPGDQPAQGLHVHRLVLTDSARGQETGSAILDWAGRRAQDAGKRWLRLDAWTTNPGLHRYYLSHGFEHVRTVEGPGIVSGVLFQRPAEITLRRGPEVHTSSAAELTS